GDHTITPVRMDLPGKIDRQFEFAHRAAYEPCRAGAHASRRRPSLERAESPGVCHRLPLPTTPFFSARLCFLCDLCVHAFACGSAALRPWLLPFAPASADEHLRPDLEPRRKRLQVIDGQRPLPLQDLRPHA